MNKKYFTRYLPVKKDGFYWANLRDVIIGQYLFDPVMNKAGRVTQIHGRSVSLHSDDWSWGVDTSRYIDQASKYGPILNTRLFLCSHHENSNFCYGDKVFCLFNATPRGFRYRDDVYNILAGIVEISDVKFIDESLPNTSTNQLISIGNNYNYFYARDFAKVIGEIELNSLSREGDTFTDNEIELITSIRIIKSQ